MSKERLCTKCTYNNNGWCNKRKTNKGLKELTDCKYRKTESTVKLNNFLEQKRFELEIEDNAFNRGMVKGLEIALRILNE